MKKRLTLLISLIMLLGMTVIAEASDYSAFYDFENYSGGNPAGWSSSFVDSLSAVQVDAEHGTSMRVKTSGTMGGRPTITFPETISEGKFLISFEVRTDDNYKNFRLMMFSPTSNSDAHSFFMINNANYLCSAVSTQSAWSFPELVEYEYKRWYQVDILINFEEKNIQYYIDGVLKDKQSCGFTDFNKLICMTEKSAPPAGETGYIYLDNFTFKYTSPGTMSSGAGNNLVMAGADTIDVYFSDLVSSGSLKNAVGYDMGTNPISYTARQIPVERIATGAKKATFKFSEPFEPDRIYKLSLEGAMSSFGYKYENNAIYFATSRTTTLQTPVDVAFSDVTGTDNTYVLGANNPSWVKWTYKGTRAIIEKATDAESGDIVLRLAPKGAVWGTEPSIEINRDFGNELTDSLTMECKMKIVKGNQYFIVYDSERKSLDLLTFKNDGIYYGDLKIADAIFGQWFVVKASFDQRAGTVTFDINGTTTDALSYKDDQGVNKIANVKEFAIKQTNAQYNAPVAERAESYYAYYKVHAQMAPTAPMLVTFVDDSGEVYYPDEKIPSNADKINIVFTGNVSDTTLSSGVILKNNDVPQAIDTERSAYTSGNRTYSMALPDYLLGGENYELAITAGVENVSGESIRPVTGSFTTDTGILKANNLDIDVNGGTVTVNSEVTHTDAENDGKILYLVYAAFQGDLMIDLKTNPIVLDTQTKKKYVSNHSYTLPQNADDVRVFLWKGFGITPEDMEPLTPLKSKEITNS